MTFLLLLSDITPHFLLAGWERARIIAPNSLPKNVNKPEYAIVFLIGMGDYVFNLMQWQQLLLFKLSDGIQHQLTAYGQGMTA